MADHLRISGGHMSAPLPPAVNEQGLKCPRCDSPNTKFCYYNNYSLSQPRHFCKTCRRYWTRGGALRNVPVGGGCRKNKKFKCPASSRLRTDPISALPETVSPAAGFLAEPRLQAPAGSQVMDVPPNYAAALISSGAVPVVGFCTYPVPVTGVYSHGGGSSAANNSYIESSMESLIGSINQDQRWNLSVISGGDQARNLIPESAQRPNTSSTQWLQEIAYPVLPSGSGSAINNSNNSGSNAKTSTSYWNGQQPAWNETLQFTALP